MSLSTIDKKHSEKLLESLSKNNNDIEFLKSHHSQYAQLKIIFSQMNHLKNEAIKIINEGIIQEDLHKIKKNFNLVSGNSYYLYENFDKEKFFSLISPIEWNNKFKFLGKYYYDYDKQFILE